jgi:hypothetical protein
MSIFQDVRERVSISDAISFLGLHVKQESPGQFRTTCPNCKGSEKRDLSINTEKGFRCFRSDKKGNDATALVAHVRGTSQTDAAKMLHEHFISAARPQRSVPQPQEEGDLQPLAYLEHEHPVIEMLGLTPAACEALGAGYAPRGTMAGRILIPLRMPDGKLTGYLGIATKPDQDPLLLFPKNLEDRCAPTEKPAPDEMRKLFRVVS